jgi:ParB-like chromosome segregation protein Spo0J
MQTIDLRVDQIRDYDRNPRKNDDSVEKTAHAINEYGFLVPILVDPGHVVIDGHLRLKAARMLGMETVPCVVVEDLDPVKIKALRLSVNRIAQDAGWDEDLLRLELTDLLDDGYEIELAGFETNEIGRLLDELADSPDFAPTLEPETSISSVTQSDVDKTEKKLGERFSEAGADNYKGVICPHCGQEFWME